MVRDDLTEAINMRRDLATIRGDGVSNTPMGLRYLADSANVFAANGTVNLANVTTDLSSMMLRLEEANIPMIRPGWIFAPRIKHYLMTVRDGNGNFAFKDEIMAGTLMGAPFRTTSQVPRNLGGGTESEVYFADWAQVLYGDTFQLILDVSTEASYMDSGTLVSAFSRDETVVRVISEHDTGLRHDLAVSILTGVTWGA